MRFYLNNDLLSKAYVKFMVGSWNRVVFYSWGGRGLGVAETVEDGSYNLF